MSIQVKLRTGTTAQHGTFTGANGELTVDTDKKVVVVHDGTTLGGTPLAKEAHNHTGTYLPNPSGSPVQGDILYHDGSAWSRLGPGTSGQVLKTQGAGANPLWGTSGGAIDLLMYQNQQPSGTAGPPYSSGTWEPVVLNTEVMDTGGIGTLSSNQITLPAGNYEFLGMAVYMGPTNGAVSIKARSRLWNITDSNLIMQGINQTHDLTMGGGAVSLTCPCFGAFVLSGTKTVAFQMYTSNTTSQVYTITNGYAEIYATVQFKRFS